MDATDSMRAEVSRLGAETEALIRHIRALHRAAGISPALSDELVREATASANR